MQILGLAGGLNSPTENRFQFPWFFHDAAAVLLSDGQPAFAIEEERLNRIKHSTCFPVQAISAALDHAGIDLSRIDHIAYYFAESYLDSVLSVHYHQHPELGPVRPVRELVDAHFQASFGQSVSTRLRFIDHHLSHAASAFYPSGFEAALVLVADGMGEHVSLTVYDADARGLHKLTSFDSNDSPGLFYLTVTEHLGYAMFDEYKLMGLASYGNASRWQHLFDECCQLLPEGRYRISRKALRALLNRLCAPRHPGAPLTQHHQDVAAAAQASLERMLLHVCRHWQRETGHRAIALAGGVAHNCTFNGRLLRENLFAQVFVQPAAHDAGCALGAALHLAREHHEPPLRGHVTPFLGRPIEHGAELRRHLSRWESLVTVSQPAALLRTTAERLAEGQTAGWVQGRSEFGPRALGHRSILADPRPATHRDKINRIIKQREGFRPFAPAVLDTALSDLYEIPATSTGYDAMTYTVSTRADQQGQLGAVTHTDGSARVQSVSQIENPLFWSLIDAFRQLTGVAVLLNTSFNNHVEPIVDSVDDALTCFLTTGLDFLVIGEFLIEKRGHPTDALGRCHFRLPPPVQLEARDEGFELWHCHRHQRVRVSAVVAKLLGTDHAQTVDQHPACARLAPDDAERVLQELFELWSERLICCRHETISP